MTDTRPQEHGTRVVTDASLAGDIRCAIAELDRAVEAARKAGLAVELQWYGSFQKIADVSITRHL